MKYSLLGALVSVLLIAADDPKAQRPQADQQRLLGTWSVVKAERSNKPADEVAQDKVVFENEKVTIQRPNKRSESASYTIDPKKTPKTIDLRPGDEKDLVVHGIYLLDGDNLKLCMARPGEERPTDFSPKEGSHYFLVVLKRERSTGATEK